MTTSTRLKLRKLVKYAVVTQVIAWVMIAFSGEWPDRYSLGWSALGIWIGFLEEFTFGRRFRSFPVPVQILGKAALVNVFSLILIVIAYLVDKQRITNVFQFLNLNLIEALATPELGRLIIRTMIVSVAVLLVIQTEEVFGRRSFLGALLGSYDRPRQEEKVVMTIDLVSSTALGEQLGDMRYFDLLNYTYSLMTDAILRNEAVIHKYIGDEVIFTWPIKQGLRHMNCLDLFFDIQQRIQDHEEEYIREFGMVPQYRGAVHCGPVISARIGHIKRAVDLSGDVMNTVSRMLALAKEYKQDLVVSTRLLARIRNAEERFELGPAKLVKLRGKTTELPVHSIQRQRLG